MVNPKIERDDKTADLVKRCVLAGVPIKRIAKIVDISENILRREYGKEIEDTKDLCGANVAGKLYNSAINGNITAMIFYLKTQLGWKETNVNELTGPDGEPLPAAAPPALNIIIDGVKSTPASQAGDGAKDDRK